MKFQNEHGLTPDGVATPETWNALLAAATAGSHAPAHYSYVEVSQHTPEVMKLWKDGKVVVKGAANTGISSAPTPRPDDGVNPPAVKMGAVSGRQQTRFNQRLTRRQRNSRRDRFERPQSAEGSSRCLVPLMFGQ